MRSSRMSLSEGTRIVDNGTGCKESKGPSTEGSEGTGEQERRWKSSPVRGGEAMPVDMVRSNMIRRCAPLVVMNDLAHESRSSVKFSY